MQSTTLAFSIGNDVLGLGEGAKAGFWAGLAEKVLKIATTPNAAGGMAMMVLSGALAAVMLWKHRDSNSKFDLSDLGPAAAAIVDIGMFFVGVKLAFF